MVSVATIVSAFFILTANAWMQHPVGYRIVGNKAELTDFWALLGNSTAVGRWTHTVLAAFVTGAMFVLGVSAWRLLRGDHVAAFTRTAKLGAWVALAGVVATMVAGDWQARLMDDQQPMKMAAAEAVYQTRYGASFSLLTIGNLSGQPVFQIRIPHLLSLIATLSWNGKVVGIAQAQHDEVLKHGPGSYVPVLWVTYWSFRLMVGPGFPDPDHLRVGAVAVPPRRQAAARPAAGPCGSSWPASPRRSRPTRSAGCSPRWDGSPGSCTA